MQWFSAFLQLILSCTSLALFESKKLKWHIVHLTDVSQEVQISSKVHGKSITAAGHIHFACKIRYCRPNPQLVQTDKFPQ